MLLRPAPRSPVPPAPPIPELCDASAADDRMVIKQSTVVKTYLRDGLSSFAIISEVFIFYDC